MQFFLHRRRQFKLDPARILLPTLRLSVWLAVALHAYTMYARLARPTDLGCWVDYAPQRPGRLGSARPRQHAPPGGR